MSVWRGGGASWELVGFSILREGEGEGGGDRQVLGGYWLCRGWSSQWGDPGPYPCIYPTPSRCAHGAHRGGDTLHVRWNVSYRVVLGANDSHVSWVICPVRLQGGDGILITYSI